MSQHRPAAHGRISRAPLDGIADAGLVAASHERSRRYGLSADDSPDFSVESPGRLSEALERNRKLTAHAVPVMETLCEQIRNTHSMVVLTDADGLILHAFGDDDFLARADKVALRRGVDWSEAHKGTNAIGTALAEGQATVVHAAQHFLKVNHFLTCSCAPIVDPRGALLGALDVTGARESYHQHTMALVRMSAQMIENQLFHDTYADAIRIHFHSRPEFIGTLVEGLAAFNGEGQFLAANRSALFQLGMPLAALSKRTFSELFGIPLLQLVAHVRGSGASFVSACMHNGVAVALRAEWTALPRFVWPQAPHPRAEATSPVGDVRAVADHGRGSALASLCTGDPLMGSIVARLQRVRNQGVPILLVGEAGSGKETVARAIHDDSDRARGPFVVVHCDAPPAQLEEELFAPSRSRLAAAHGGTLFLDDIGALPAALQLRLVRVLEDRRLAPPSGAPIGLDFALVCAHPSRLLPAVEAHAFNEELYFRLNGLVVSLPPLRMRADLKELVRRLVDRPVDEAVMALLRAYRWPGNIRQLEGILRTARLLAADAPVIGVGHLPEDFLAALRQPEGHPLVEWEASAVPVPASASRLEEVELATIRATLAQHRGNISAAARALGVSRNTIYRRLAARGV